jgi:hypothetical protein
MKHRSILIMVLLIAVGCSRRSEEASQEHTQPATETSIAVLGDDTRTSFRNGLIQAGCNASSSASAHAEERIAIIAAADACVVVMDSTWGPKPIHREDILLASQFSRGPVFIALSKTSFVYDAELLELEELEMREVMNAYGLPGDTAGVFFDSNQARTRSPRGYAAAAKVLLQIPKQQGLNKTAPVEGSSPATIYCLTVEESFIRDMATTLQSGTFDFVFCSGPTAGSIQFASPLSPGSSGEGRITLEKGTDIGPKGKFVIVKKKHVIGVGAMMQEAR